MKVAFRDSISGKVKSVGIGWSWTLFLFSGLFGIPLFRRRLYLWGSICLTLACMFLLSFLLIIGGLNSLNSNTIDAEDARQAINQLKDFSATLVILVLVNSIYL
jgi:hypothetical protein